MALTYLKIEPEKAVPILEGCVTKGYALKDELEKRYRATVNGDVVNSEHITEWSTELKNWTNESLEKLAFIFISPRQQYNFRDAKVSGLHRIGVNMKYDNIVTMLQARIDVLDGYINFIFQHGNIQIVAGRDVLIQTGEASKMEVKQ